MKNIKNQLKITAHIYFNGKGPLKNKCEQLKMKNIKMKNIKNQLKITAHIYFNGKGPLKNKCEQLKMKNKKIN
jgi:galactose mutarotase-like enzyme